MRNVKELEKVEQNLYELMVEWGTPEYIRVTFKEIEVFKGTKSSPNYLIEFPLTVGNCMLGLLPGLEYVIFLSKNSLGLVAACSGTFSLIYSGSTTETEAKMIKLREWKK